jgi:flavin reductase (DIM6/NTAB) family NADH-FMN oxidoreductase RutF
MTTTEDDAFDVRSFRFSLGQFPTGVCIVTAVVGGELLGTTMSSFNSLSLDPPLVLFSIDKRARGLPQWQAATDYAINVLSESQKSISDRFARPSSDKWEGVSYVEGTNGIPLLPGSAAMFECEAHAEYEAGDHVLFIARVRRFHTKPQRQPLVFCKGTYGELQQSDDTAAIWPLDIHY